MVKKNQRGGKIVLPTKFFNDNYSNHYLNSEQLNSSNSGHVGKSFGSVNTDYTTGPNLVSKIGLNPQVGGAPLPAEYFGNDSGRYFAEGAPELETCTTAYGVNMPTSHGVVLDVPGKSWMGPNTGPFPKALHMTGGAWKQYETPTPPLSPSNLTNKPKRPPQGPRPKGRGLKKKSKGRKSKRSKSKGRKSIGRKNSRRKSKGKRKITRYQKGGM